MFVNLTPHKVVVMTSGGKRIFPPSGIVCRMISKTKEYFTHDGIVIKSIEVDGVQNLPQEKHDTYYIVSKVVAEAMQYRDDLVAPDEMIKNTKTGEIYACKCLTRGKRFK
jgi:hypothetical protein